MTITPERIAELRRLLNEATPGPWEAGKNKRPNCVFSAGDTYAHTACHEFGSFGRFPALANAALIAAARNALPGLLDALEAAQAMNNKSSCLYCGYVGPKDPNAILEHMATCEHHPTHKLLILVEEMGAERDQLRAERDAALEDARSMQARLQRVVDGAEQLRAEVARLKIETRQAQIDAGHFIMALQRIADVYGADSEAYRVADELGVLNLGGTHE